jgi:arabinose-5-phosphate isomerase
MFKSAVKLKPMSANDILHAASHVLLTEGDALKALADKLDGAFVKATETVMACKGRVVVTGMGKSGHIARKIAATFASTGTPSHFVHPGEASHGDLGMIVPQDVVIALSNSGETSELADMIAYTRRFAIPLIAMTGRAQSSLGDAADVTLQLPAMPEVCPMGLAPTTSTTMMLALGDALAVAVLEAKGFTADDFRNFHPGGKLGKALMRVRDVMRTGSDLPLVAAGDLMPHVLVVMTGKALGCAGVVEDGGKLLGMITDYDLRNHMKDGFLTKKASEIMNKTPKTVSAQILAAEALKILNETTHAQMFVVEDGKLTGIIHIHDLLRAGIA